jgi:uncharacterized membrane protein
VQLANPIKSLARSLSMLGIMVGLLLFSVSLTPSLLPRGILVQGILSGCAFAVGYGIGTSLQWVWDYMELKLPEGRFLRWTRIVAVLVCMAIAVFSLFQTIAWQNTVRAVMGIPPVEEGLPLFVLLVAILPAAFLIIIGKLLVFVVRLVSRQLNRIMPPRVAFVGSLVIVGILTIVLVNGVLLRSALRGADAFFERLDAFAGQFGDPPGNPLRSGSSASLIAWETIGHDGRIYVESGPSRAEIESVVARPALDPLRVYVGLRSAPTEEERARLALAELIRVGGFNRSVLVIIMPVGTGWVDPPGIDSLEYLMAGDVASVALQYSYLTSPLSLVVEPDYGTGAAQTLFKEIYNYWTGLPRNARPRLYLNGLSLGAHSSQASTQVFDVLADPFQGALWVGPPYTSPIWRWATTNRQAGSPEWLPRFGNDTSIRFTNTGGGLVAPNINWGPIRMAFLQHPSDPIVFFSYSALYRTPDWLIGKRGPDVSPALTWYPVVTFLQLGIDMALAQTSPPGHGHVYAAAEYVDAWMALIEPPGWDKPRLDALKAVLAKRSSP